MNKEQRNMHILGMVAANLQWQRYLNLKDSYGYPEIIHK